MTASLITGVVAATLWLIARLGLTSTVKNLVAQGRIQAEAYTTLLTVCRGLLDVVWASAMLWLYLHG